MDRGRNLEYWHIPKRSSSHQMVGAINVLIKEGMDGVDFTEEGDI